MHGKIICKKCNKIIAQCRCMEGHTHVEYQVCEDCQRLSKESASEKKKFKFEWTEHRRCRGYVEAESEEKAVELFEDHCPDQAEDIDILEPECEDWEVEEVKEETKSFYDKEYGTCSICQWFKAMGVLKPAKKHLFGLCELRPGTDVRLDVFSNDACNKFEIHDHLALHAHIMYHQTRQKIDSKNKKEEISK